MSGDHRDLHVLPHSFPTRRSSDLTRSARRSAPPRSRTPWRGPFHTRCQRFRVPAAADWTASNPLSRYICSLATFVAHPWQALYFPNTIRPLDARWAGSYPVTPDQVQRDEEIKIPGSGSGGISTWINIEIGRAG